MSDLVVCVPRDFWFEWIAEGDAAGTPATGEEWGYYTGGGRPPIEPGERVYIISHGRLRGYSVLTRLTRAGEQWALCRRAEAHAITVPDLEIERVSPNARPGFRGWRKRWWDRAAEVPFPNWQWEGVEVKCLIGWCRPRAMGVYAVAPAKDNPHQLVNGMVCQACGLAHARRQLAAGVPMTDFARELLAKAAS